LARTDVTRDDLAEATRAALGSGRQLEGVARLAGWTTKGAYRLTLDDRSTFVAYLWGESENFWPPTVHDGDLADQFSSGNSPLVVQPDLHVRVLPLDESASRSSSKALDYRWQEPPLGKTL
jgi:hypothetical protein